MARVQTGCPDCKRCTNSAVGEGARKAGRWTAGIATMGLSEAGMAFTRNCRGCGHAMSLHDRKDNSALTRDPDHRGAPVVPGHGSPYPPAPAPAWGAPPLGARSRVGRTAPGPDSRVGRAAPGARPGPGARSGAPAQNAQEIMGLLRQLGELRDAGVITAADFEAKKADFLEAGSDPTEARRTRVGRQAGSSPVSGGMACGRRTMSEPSEVATMAKGNRSSSRQSSTSSG